MISPTVSVAPPEGSSTPEQSTRRRGLSYLRSLSSHNSTTNTADQLRSPRHFFQRSSSYNNESKSKQQPATGRRRSASRPNEPTSPPSERLVLTRVLSAGNSPAPSPALVNEEFSSGEDIRLPREQERTQIPSDFTTAAVNLTSSPEDMARSARPARPSTPRRVTDSALPTVAEGTRTQTTNGNRPTSVSISNGSSVTNGGAGPAKSDEEKEKPKAPMIRFFPHQDLRNNGRQSLNFSPVSRTLPSETAIIRVGRYSEREGLPVAHPPHPSDAPVGFKSKVVSRKHCEFSFVDGQWHIRDVASSSGTFLNHIRLSQPNQESRLFPIKDGDIVQLGIDFRGGEEMIFRCVKIRIECNRSWQKKPNNFNKIRQAQLLGLSKDQPAAGQNNGECSICLGSVLPCQALFVAPCAHVWHYKCIRPMIEGRQAQYPSFQCPNCRAWTDLEAEVDVAEEDMDAWMENGNDTDEHLDIDQSERPEAADNHSEAVQAPNGDVMPPVPEEAPIATTPIDVPAPATPKGGLLSRRPNGVIGTNDTASANSIPMPARPSQEEMGDQLAQQSTRTESGNGEHIIAGEGPLTPRNNAGPFVFDGSGGTGENRRRTLFVPGLFEVAEHAPA